MERDPEFLEDFLEEAAEHLSTVEDDVLALEQPGDTPDPEIVNRLFRSLHTVKGGAYLMQFQHIGDLAHALENVVGLIRDGELLPERTTGEVLLKGIDKLKLLFENIEDETISIGAEVDALSRHLEGASGAPPPSETPADTAPTAAAARSVERDPEFLADFLEEAEEHLSTVEDDVIALEQRGENVDPDTVNRLFRSLHTVKGGANMLEFVHVGSLAHALENVVGLIREGSLTPDRAVAEALLKGIDKLKFQITNLNDETIEGEAEAAALAALVEKGNAPPPPAAPETPVAPPPPSEEHDPPAREERGPAGEKPAAASAFPRAKPSGDQSVRIPLALLDRLMNLATELVLVRNQNARALQSGNLEQLFWTGQGLDAVTSDLQASIMQTRMRPVGTVFSKFGRIVRDLAGKLKKEVDMEILGSDVELDKAIIEGIGDPLTHLVRNAIDHGIESPEERRKAGKSSLGLIRLSASHQSGQVNIQIQDDGKGMDPEVLKAAAVRKGILTPQEAEACQDKDAFKLIFEPGFSTAADVTSISGRGVGMDVVKSNFQKLGGTVDIDSTVGRGTTITITLPLTLAIVPSLIVTLRDQCFAIPQVSVEEVVWLPGHEADGAIKKVDEQEVYWLRHQLLPIIRLADVLGVTEAGIPPAPRFRGGRWPQPGAFGPPAPEEPVSGVTTAGGNVYIVVLSLGHERFGLLVDTVIDTEEIVVKPLHDQLGDEHPFAGTSVLGDGRIALILEIATVAELGRLRPAKADIYMAPPDNTAEELRNVLLFHVGGEERFAMPLCLVARVDRVLLDEIQIANGSEYLRHRDTLIPLVRLERVIPRIEAEYPPDRLLVIIPKCQKPFGIPVANILDTAEANRQIDSETIRQPCILGSQFIAGQLTLFVDAFAVIEAVEPDWFAEEKGHRKRMLLVEDSGFSQMLITSYFHGTGISFEVAENGEAGLEALSKTRFDGVICDIEMPVMDGYEFARRVRALQSFADMPLLAISATEGNIRPLALNAGFDDYKTKYDREGLVGSVLKFRERTSGM